MLQIIQYQKTGDISVEELPAPQLRPGGVLVRNVFSLISAGTERMSVETAQASMIGKARSRPDLVRQVIENSKREGLVATWQKVQNRLDNYKDLGYSSAGIVVESSCDDYAAGDRVACGLSLIHIFVAAFALLFPVTSHSGAFTARIVLYFLPGAVLACLCGRLVARTFACLLYTSGSSAQPQADLQTQIGILQSESILGQVIADLRPVSYTHLDVYKRQGVDPAAYQQILRQIPFGTY